MARTVEDAVHAQNLSHDDVTRLVGDLDDSVIAAILATGASYAEIERALKWVGAGREEPRMNAEGLTPVAELVCDILLSTADFTDDDLT